jgi:hypothetical protein
MGHSLLGTAILMVLFLERCMSPLVALSDHAIASVATAD